ncbi:sensor histidine kinase [Niabella aurantiaca]|uniref:ATP-binding protein n=1 Tax=Niabella aurantiaca TaxID=379900 RepID=UPI00039F6147|nr:sensor histidine kinase [Niabella aurantiaca]
MKGFPGLFFLLNFECIMYRHIYKLFAAFCLLMPFISPGQSREIDSLKALLAGKNMQDSSRVEALLMLGWDLSFFNTDSARIPLRQCILLAQKRNSDGQVGSGYAYIGSSYFNEDKFDSALYYYRLAEMHFLKDTTAEGRENVMVNRMSMGTVALQQNQYEEALGHYFKVISYLKNATAGDWPNLLTAYANVGLVYNDMKQFGKALEYHTRALEVFQKHPMDLKKKAQVQMFVALDLLNLRKFGRFTIAIDSAELIIKKLNAPYLNSSFYAIKGRYFNDIHDYRKAIAVCKKALGYAQTANQKFETANIFFQLGRSYFHLRDYAQSLRYLLPGLSIHKALKDRTRERISLNYIARAYYRDKNYKEAARYFEAYGKLSDSLHGSEIQIRINEIENRYQGKRKEDSILVLQKNNQLQQLALHKKQYQGLFIIIGASLLLAAGLLLYRNLRSKHRLLKQSEQLHEQQIAQLEKERQLIAAQSLMKGQEEERSRLAKDLHDGVGGLLSGVKLSLSNMKGNVFLSEENAKAVATIIGQLDSSIHELRRVSHNMMPEALIKFGLKEALENYCESIDQSGKLNVRLQTYGLEQRMEQDTEIILYRVVQELLNNVVKHADARQALVQLVREPDKFTLTVEDDGKGFDSSDPQHRKGAGLQNIQARAGYLNGIVDIRTRPGEGTSVTIEGTPG